MFDYLYDMVEDYKRYLRDFADLEDYAREELFDMLVQHSEGKPFDESKFFSSAAITLFPFVRKHYDATRAYYADMRNKVQKAYMPEDDGPEGDAA